MLESGQQIYNALLCRSELLQEQMMEISYALNMVEIVPVWLKGANTLISSNWKNSCRLMNDLDFWLPDPSQHKSAIKALDQLGYFVKPPTKDPDWKLSHHYAPRMHAQRTATLEVHRHLIRPSFAHLLPDNNACSNIQWLRWNGLSIGVLALNDQISQSLVQCTVMATPQLNSGFVRMMKVIDLLRLLEKTNKQQLPEIVINRIESGETICDIITFMTFFEAFFSIRNPFGNDPSLIHLLEKNNYTPERWLRKNSLKAPANWRQFFITPTSWPSKLSRRIRMLTGKT
jgi:hypothetical protein